MLIHDRNEKKVFKMYICVRRKLKLRVALVYAQTAQCPSLFMPLKTLGSGRGVKCRSNPSCRSLLRALPCARGGSENLRWVYALADVMWNPACWPYRTTKKSEHRFTHLWNGLAQ